MTRLPTSSRSRPARALSWAAGIAGFLLLAAGSSDLASAQEGGLELRSSIGFGRHVRSGSWTPLVISTRNHGPRIQGQLVFEEESGSFGEAGTRFERPLELPRHSRKRSTLYVRISSPGRHAARLLSADGAELLTIPVDTRLISPADRFVGFIGRGGSSLAPMIARWLDSDEGGELVVARAAPEDLPSDSIALEGLDTLVWLEPSEAPLEADALATVLDWVLDGGHLVLAAGEDWSDLTAPPLGPLLPLQLQSRLPAPEGIGAPAGALLGWGEMAPGGELLLGSREWPLLTRRHHGHGRIDLIAFHPERRPVFDTKLPGEVWEQVLAPLPPPKSENAQRGGHGWTEEKPEGPEPMTPRRAPGIFAPLLAELDPPRPLEHTVGQLGRLGGANIQGNLSQLETLEPVPLGWLLALMLLYVVLIGPVDYIVLRRLGRLEWTWITFPALILLFTVLVYGLSLLNRSDRLVLNGIEIVDHSSAHPDGGHIDGLYGLVSPTRSRLRLEARSSASLIDRSSVQYGNSPWTMSNAPGRRARSIQADPVELEIPMRRFSIEYVDLRGRLAEGQLRARLDRSQPGELAIEIEGDIDVADASVYLAAVDRIWDLGPVNLPGRHRLVLDDAGIDTWFWPRFSQLHRMQSPRTWSMPMVIGLSMRSEARALSVLQAQQAGGYFNFWYMQSSWGHHLDLGPKPAPVLFVDGGPLREPALGLPGIEREISGRRIHRVHVDLEGESP